MKFINPSLRQIEAFVWTCSLGSLTAAAERMSLTQSAVSVLIRQLELGVGAQLLDRTTRTLHPTAAGREVLPRAQRLLRDRDSMVSAVKALADVEQGRISFAVTAAVASALMPGALAQFSRQHPGVAIAMQDVAPDQLVAKVLAEEVEFSIGTITSPPREIAQETLISDRLSAICRRDDAFGRRSEVSWDEVLRTPCICVGPGNGIRELIDATLARKGKKIVPAWEVAFLTTALSMTAQGLGITITPGYLVAYLQYPMLVAVPLRNPVVRRNLTVISRAGRSLSPAARRFIDLFKSMSAGDAQENTLIAQGGGPAPPRGETPPVRRKVAKHRLRRRSAHSR
jgi:DNA-binding transcriptional LysR family regulator